MRTVPIGKLSKMTGCNIETIRYYERIGLLPKPARSASGHRRYDDSDAERLRFVRRCRELGFGLDSIRQLLTLAEGTGDRYGCREVREMTLAHVDEIHSKIADLRRMERVLKEIASRCDGDDLPTCPILEALSS
jgi:MerR family mercuric resistance operon transcriptional regulator